MKAGVSIRTNKGWRPGGWLAAFMALTLAACSQPAGVRDSVIGRDRFDDFDAIAAEIDFDEAMDVANNTEFGLTGGLFSNVPERLERAREDLHVGNLYLNRKITGAMVGVHPFGGFNMSGTDSKGGGPDYLLLFMQGKSIAEKKAS